MRISAKGRYGLAAILWVASVADAKTVSVAEAAQSLGLSKIYLEQVFSPLKKAGLLRSVKGAHGGYTLAKPSAEIDLYEILKALNEPLFEPAAKTFEERAPYLEQTLTELVYEPLDAAVKTRLSDISLAMLVARSNELLSSPGDFMFYI